MSIVRDIRPRTSFIKPPLGRSIQWGHPRLKGLAAWWTFDEGGGNTIVDRLHGFRGTLTNGPTWAQTAKGTVVDFGASDYITVPDDGRLDLAGASTIFARVFARSFTTGSDENRIILKGSGTHGGSSYTLDMFDDGGGVNILYYNNTMGFLIGNTVLPTNTWMDLCAVWDGLDMTVWFNGVLDGTNLAPAGLPTTNSSPVIMGGRAGPSTDSLDGQISEIRLYDRALRPAEIFSLTLDPDAEVETRRYWSSAELAPAGVPTRLLLTGVGV